MPTATVTAMSMIEATTGLKALLLFNKPIILMDTSRRGSEKPRTYAQDAYDLAGRSSNTEPYKQALLFA
jgi:hypothetical protein